MRQCVRYASPVWRYACPLPEQSACVALADTVAGSVSDFVTLMNEKAEKLGMTGTRLQFYLRVAPGRSLQYSQGYRIFLLTDAIKNSTFRKVLSRVPLLFHARDKYPSRRDHILQYHVQESVRSFGDWRGDYLGGKDWLYQCGWPLSGKFCRD